MIYCYSGTGNSAYAAEKLSPILGETVTMINRCIKQKKRASVHPGERIVFVVPTYGWRIPRLVEEWILKSDIQGEHQVYFLMTCGDGIGNAGHYLKKLCEKKQLQYMGCGEIVMPENYIAMFKAPQEQKAKEIIQRAEPVIEAFGTLIAQGKELPEKKKGVGDRIGSRFVNPLFYTACMKPKKFYVKENCTGCGKCQSVCVLDNITLTDGKPVWGKKCTQCMACISYCPEEAIEYGKSTKGKVRYHCPK